jgi:hypothetical protein
MKLPLQHQSCWAHLLRESHTRACRSDASDEILLLHKKLKTMFLSLQKIVKQPFEPERRKKPISCLKYKSDTLSTHRTNTTIQKKFKLASATKRLIYSLR